MQYKIKILPSSVEYTSDKNLLDDALTQSIALEHSCKSGACGVCSAEIVSGTVQNESGEVVTSGSVLTCCSKALSDTVIKAHYYPELSHINQQTLPCKVSSIEYVTDDIVVLKFRFPPTAVFEFLPGQYIDLSYKGIKRSYSIANSKSNSNEIELHLRKVAGGQMSELIFDNVKENQLMRIEGPKGTFFIRNTNKKLILMATGTGIAPVKAMVEQLISSNDNRDIHIYWGMQYKHELYCKDLLQYANDYEHVKYTPVLSREKDWGGRSGYIQDVVAKDFDVLTDVEVYACGSLQMINDAKQKFINEKQLFPDAFHSDAFTPAI